MAEYYGFKDAGEVNANPVVDWGTIAMKVGQDLDKNKENRQRLRAEDQKITSDNLEILSKAEYGADQTINKKLTDDIYDNKKLQGEWYNQLKNGKMTRQEYASRSQNLKNNWSTMNSLFKNKATNDKVLMDKVLSNSSDALTDAMAKDIGTLYNLENKGLYTDTEGNKFIAEYDKDGKIIEESIISPGAINNVQLDAADKINVVEAVKPISASAAQLITDNGIRSLEDAMRSKSYPQMRKAAAESVLSSNRRIADVLVKSSGMGYTLTKDPKEAESNPLAILYKSSGGKFEVILDPVKDAKKIQDAEEFVGKVLDFQMPFIEKVTLPTPRQPRATPAPKEDKDPPPTIIETNILTRNNKQSAYSIINDPVGIKTNSGFIEKVVNVGIDEDGRHFVKVMRYNTKENTGAEAGSTSYSVSQTTPEDFYYYREDAPTDKGSKNKRKTSPTSYAIFRNRAGFTSDDELRSYLEESQGFKMPTYKKPAKTPAGKQVKGKTGKKIFVPK